MDYHKHYQLLIARARQRGLVPGEIHHITPRCVGGDDSPENLVALTLREHYVAHQLLTKMYPQNPKLALAAQMMCVGSHRSNRAYEWVRRRAHQAISKLQSGQANSQFGKIWVTDGKQNRLVAEDSIPLGWQKGRHLVGETKKLTDRRERKIKRDAERARKIELANAWDEIYSRVGFEKFKQLANYQHSKPALCQFLSRYSTTFVPQNGKKR